MSRRFINAKVIEIEISGMKNVLGGKIVFQEAKELLTNKKVLNTHLNHIIGIYGPNGSGKSTIIETLTLTKKIVDSSPFSFKLSDDSYNYNDFLLSLVNRKKNKASNRIKIFVEKVEEKKIFDYSYSIEKIDDFYSITSEILKVKKWKKEVGWSKLKTVFEFNAKNNIIRLDGRKLKSNSVFFTKLMSYQEQKKATNSLSSFFFDKASFELIEKEARYGEIFENMIDVKEFFIRDLFVLSHSEIGDMGNVILPLSISLDDEQRRGHSIFCLKLIPNKKMYVSLDDYSNLIHIFLQINAVLGTIIKDTKLEIRNTEENLDKNGHKIMLFEITCVKDTIEIPLIHESDGIKRLISMISILITAYNDPKINVFIDEIDSGVFEFLLGELIQVLHQYAKGFIFFTAHNLRPLEKIDPKCIYFTTTNPSDRYSKMNIQTNNNARKVYFTDLQLGREAGDDFGDLPTVSAIQLAFYKAGQPL